MAHDADLGREVALKELRPERGANPAMEARFLREARITGQLQHPGIVPVYELVPAPGGPDAKGPFYTMRFVQGRTLTEAVREYHAKRAAGGAGALDLATLLNAFVNVCNTVAYAHSRGVIHRDLKGQNVVLGEFGEVMVLDWGFAKLLGRPDEDLDPAAGPDPGLPADRTIAGQVLGTPAYMAPEQAAGRAERIDERTDVYGLGAILYEILTGQPPFTGTDTAEVLRKVREGEPPPPAAVRPGTPPELAAVCMRALARDPAERYPGPAELASEVRRWLADEPVAAYREPLAARLRRWARRHKPVVAGLAALLATALPALAIGTALLQREQARTAAARERAAEVELEVEAGARRALETQLYYHCIALAERELAADNLKRATQLLASCPRALRGWEWHCLNRLCHSEVLALTGHTAAVSSVAFSPDGRTLASASHDHTVRLWDLPPPGLPGAANDPGRPARGVPVRTLTGHADVVYGLAFSPDGTRLATASWDRTVKIWDVAAGREVFTFRGHGEPVLRVAFSPDGWRVASLSAGKTLVWDAPPLSPRSDGLPAGWGEQVVTLGEVGGMNRYGLAYSPDGRLVAVTTHGRAVVLWDVGTGREVRTILGHTSLVKNVAFSPDGWLLASGAGDLVRGEPGEVKVWVAATGRERFTLPGHTDPIYGVAFSPDGSRLVSASQDHTVKVWDLTTGQEALTIRAHSDTVRAVAFSPDGSRLATACADGTIKIWDGTPWADEKSGYEVQTLTGVGAAVFSAAFHPDGRALAAAADNETILVWDTSDDAGADAPRRFSVGREVYVAAYSPDGGLLATATSDGIVHLLEPATGAETRALESGRRGPIKSLAFSPDGTRLAAASWDRAVLVWDVARGEMRHTLEGHGDAVTAVAFSPDGRLLASASHDLTARVWDAATGRQLHTLAGHTSRLFGVAFHPHGSALATASNDGTVRLWDPRTGRALRTLRGHTSGVHGVAFSPGGRFLASAGHDWTVKLWDSASGEELRTLRGHFDRVQQVAFSPDGRHLASAGSDQTVRIWAVPSVGDKAE